MILLLRKDARTGRGRRGPVPPVMTALRYLGRWPERWKPWRYGRRPVLPSQKSSADDAPPANRLCPEVHENVPGNAQSRTQTRGPRRATFHSMQDGQPHRPWWVLTTVVAMRLAFADRRFRAFVHLPRPGAVAGSHCCPRTARTLLHVASIKFNSRQQVSTSALNHYSPMRILLTRVSKTSSALKRLLVLFLTFRFLQTLEESRKWAIPLFPE